jgi:hypothetical protein
MITRRARILSASFAMLLLNACGGGSETVLPPGPPGWSQVLSQTSWGTRDAGATAVHQGEMWLLGGWNYVDDQAVVLNDAWSSSDGIQWRQFTPPMSFGMYPMATSFGGQILYMGGLKNSRMPNEALSNEIWGSPNGMSWTRLVSAADWEPRIGSTLTLHAQRLWILGGKVRNSADSEDRRHDVWRSDDGRRWHLVTASAPWESRAFHCAVAHRGRIWMLGGGDWDAMYGRSDVWSSIDGAEWQRHFDAPWEGRIWHNCLSYGGRLWVIGGRLFDPIRTTDEIWSTEDGEVWRREDDAIRPGPRHAAYSAVHENRIWIMGGSAHGYLQSDVWQYNQKK